MKKIPTLFEREFKAHSIVRVLPKVTPGFKWVLKGKGIATEKVDGACCAIINGEFYKRYDAKKGKAAPVGAIPCQGEPDPVTGHFPHWVKVDNTDPADKWFAAALFNSPWITEDGTYEAVGPHFQSNPYDLDEDVLEKHGRIKIKDIETTFDGIREYLRTHEIEGIVWWKDGIPQCKIKRSDFGFPWPIKRKEGKGNGK